MSEPAPESVEALFLQAADLDPQRRVAFLDEACTGDLDLRAAVEELLHFDAKAQSMPDFLHSPAADVRAALPPAAAVPESFGRYRVVGRLGEGGMGTVYEAEQDDPRRTVALKVMRPGLDSPDLRNRFSRESRILGLLHHVGIPRVYDAGTTEDGRLYFAMEFIRGLRLDEYARRHVPDARARLELMAHVCDAVQHAHEQGVVHRDLKPANVLVDETGQPKVLDFGVAHATAAGVLGSSAHTRTGQLIGTLGYMSPDQIAGDRRALDARSDVYTLGVILYELLADRLPYRLDHLTLPEMMRVIREEEPSRLGSVNRHFRGAVETIVSKALEKDRARRYQSAGELAEDLRRHLAHEQIQARPAGRIQKTVKWGKRHPGVAASLAGLVTLFLAAFVLVSWGYVREAKLRQEAQENERAERWGRYRSSIAAASGALQLQNSGAVRSALEEAPKAHRNWEWQYLHSQLDGASLVVPVPGGKPQSLVLSPSGRQIAVSGLERDEVYLYDVATGRLEAVLRGHSAPATSVAYRPDGKQVATASNDQTIRLWDPGTGQQTALLRAEVAPPNLERQPLVGYNSDGSRIASYHSWGGAGTSRLWDATTGQEIAVLDKWQGLGRPVAFSPDGKRVAVASREYVRLCDAVTGRQLAVLGPHANMVRLLAYSPDGKRLASANDDGANAIRLWDGESGNEVAVLPTGFVSTVLFSPDGSRLLSGSNYPASKACLWDAATGRSLAVLAGHKNAIASIAFSPDGRRAATASTDQTARLWDLLNEKMPVVLGGHTDSVQYILFSPNGMRVVTASDDATLRLWDAQTGELIAVLRGHGDGFDPIWPVFTPAGSRLVSGSKDGTVRVWDTSLVERNGILHGHESYVYDVAFSPDGEQVASAAWDGTARLWDATTGRQTGLLKHQTGTITSVAYSRDGRRLATRERSRGVTLWDVASQEAIRDWWVPNNDEHPRASLNPAGTLLAAVSTEGLVRLWDVATGREVARLEGHEKDSNDVAFHPDGSVLATTGLDGTVRLWDVATRAPIAVLRGPANSVLRVAFSADGKLLASGAGDKTIRLWDVQTHQQLAVIPAGSIVYGVAFSPDGTRLAAGCRDNTVRLIDVASRQQVAELRGHADYVHAVAWSPDGIRLVSCSGDHTVRVWDSLSAHERAKRAADKPTPR